MPEDLPLVTVITVTYNSARFVRDAIESILCSSYENLELIIGDDCSSDDTWTIVQTYNDKRIRAYRNEKNLGEYPNRNKAIGLAKGEYLIFIDGDDMIYPHGLDFMVRMLDAFPSCGMALMRWYKKNIFYPVEITPLQLYQGIYFGYGFNDIAFANVLFRRKQLLNIGGLTEKFKNGDDHVRLKIGALVNTLLINDHFTWWRETTGQASSLLKSNNRAYQSDYKMKLSFLEAFDCPLDEGMKKQAIRNLKISLVRNLRKLLKNFRIMDSIRLFRQTKLSLLDIPLFIASPISFDPFENYSPENPFRTDLNRNPFSKFSKVV